jgi:hypothetical protein
LGAFLLTLFNRLSSQRKRKKPVSQDSADGIGSGLSVGYTIKGFGTGAVRAFVMGEVVQENGKDTGTRPGRVVGSA